ncbi:MAG: hypothetical protein RL557_3 [archaeon]|jgi:hypothetical protein
MNLLSTISEKIRTLRIPLRRVIAEGFYDWPDTYVDRTRIALPDNTSRINFGSDLDLYIPEENCFTMPKSEQEVLGLRRLTSFQVRSIVVEDGRIYTQANLRGSQDCILDNFLKWVRDQGGFDKAYEYISQSQ